MNSEIYKDIYNALGDEVYSTVIEPIRRKYAARVLSLHIAMMKKQSEVREEEFEAIKSALDSLEVDT